MAEPKFTPGPWFVGEQNDQLYIIDKPPRPVPTDYSADIPGLHVLARVYASGPLECHVEDENACLIAAAPELYWMLREAALQIEYLQDKFNHTGSGNAVLARAEAALAKARGDEREGG